MPPRRALTVAEELAHTQKLLAASRLQLKDTEHELGKADLTRPQLPFLNSSLLLPAVALAQQPKTKLIPRPAGQAGRRKGYHLQTEVGLMEDGSRYRRLSRIVTSHADLYLPGGWPIRDLLKKYLQNSKDKLKRDLALEKVAEEEDTEIQVPSAPRRKKKPVVEPESDVEASDGEEEGKDTDDGWVDADDAEEGEDHRLQLDVDMEASTDDFPLTIVDWDDLVPTPDSTPKPRKRKTLDSPVEYLSPKRKSNKKGILPSPVKASRKPAATSRKPAHSAPASPDSPRLLPCHNTICPEHIPADPSHELQALLDQAKASPTHLLTLTICKTIPTELRRNKYFDKARQNRWPVEIDFEILSDRVLALKEDIVQIASDSDELNENLVWEIFLESIDHQVYAFSANPNSFPEAKVDAYRAGYFGPRGRSIITTTIEYVLQKQIDANQGGDDENTGLFPETAFIDYILAPFVITSLIATDLKIDLEDAANVLRASDKTGRELHPIPSPETRPEKPPAPAAKKRKAPAAEPSGP
ncbi:hypothetical protein C8R46DRAFT_1244793 [Mycena filopes]|nr:hypothetical protein C8R46DRAFT_1244793 [Mycena filopes]